jgi:outer membrane lipoprotein LolB
MHSRFLAALFVAALSGCATVAPPPSAGTAASIDSFELSARLSIRQGDKLDIAKLRWTRRGTFDLWVIASPLGNELARIEREGTAVVLTRANEPPLSSPSFATLTQSTLGVALDPDDLARWLQGTTPPVTAGWKVDVEERNADGSVRRLTAIHGDTVVKLVVDSLSGAPP